MGKKQNRIEAERLVGAPFKRGPFFVKKVNNFFHKHIMSRGDFMKKSICMLGGDERNDVLAELLKDREFIVKKYSDNDSDIESFLDGASLVICGIPFSRDSLTVNAPEFSGRVSIEKLFLSMKDNKKLLAGSFSSKVKEIANRYEIELYDFLDDEDFAIYNAIPTAEGAIEVAMKETRRTIHSSNCLVLGFGRIGKILADLLKGLHANVTVVARKDEDLAWIKAMGYVGARYSELEEILPHTDILFNTVPALVIKDELRKMKKDSLIIDLASKPGGVDFELANSLGIKAELLLGLPGKVAPSSVAEYMLKRVLKVN